MHTLFLKYYDTKYRIKSENYFCLSSHEFHIALYQAVLNWQIFANLEGTILIGLEWLYLYSRSS